MTKNTSPEEWISQADQYAAMGDSGKAAHARRMAAITAKLEAKTSRKN